MSSFLKILISFICMLSSSLIYASGICNINGSWSGFGILDLKQDGTKISGLIKNPRSACGDEAVLGEVNGQNVKFRIKPTSSKEYCNFYWDMTGNFSPNCTKIEANWIQAQEGREPIKFSLPLLRNPIRILQPNETQFVISAEPRMVDFEARSVIVESLFANFAKIPVYTWGIEFTNTYLPNNAYTIEASYFETDINSFKPNYNLLMISGGKPTERHRIVGGVLGGELTLSVEYYQNIRDEKHITILGTNPGQIAIEQMISDPTLRKIACQESRYKQFDAKREGGIGYPNGKVCGVGIMQLCSPSPTPEQAWNWRENIKAGIILYKQKQLMAKALPQKELIKMNAWRTTKGLPACKTLPALSNEQLVRETIRAYNCGDEYKWESWDDPNCKGRWIIDPSCRIDKPDAYERDYVNKVLACDINH